MFQPFLTLFLINFFKDGLFLVITHRFSKSKRNSRSEDLFITNSSEFEAQQGFLQGSHLGSILFLGDVNIVVRIKCAEDARIFQNVCKTTRKSFFTNVKPVLFPLVTLITMYYVIRLVVDHTFLKKKTKKGFPDFLFEKIRSIMKKYFFLYNV